MMLRKILLFISVVALLTNARSQATAIENKTYLPTIRTILLYSDVADYAFPVINLNTTEKLNLRFDDLKAINENYCFTMIFCNSNWVPVSLQPNEYLIGNAFEQITNFTFSSATYQKYVHYSASFPTDNMNVKYAGNYILKVYRNFNADEVVFTQRCFIVNNKSNISNRVHQATSIDLRYTNQEVDVEVDASGATIPSPYTDAKLTLIQNGRFDNAITNLTPKYINGSNYNYDYESGNLFYGGSEFRAFDTRNIRSVGQNVTAKKIDTAIHIMLKNDDARGAQQHLALPDYNGKFIITNSTASDQNLLDYTWVTFNLNSYASTPENELYVLGAFNNWQPSEACKMVYDESKKVYRCTMLLKQGYYNYGYYYKNAEGALDNTSTEGNHYETDNDYYIFFYSRNYTYNFEELIGYQKSSSALGERR